MTHKPIIWMAVIMLGFLVGCGSPSVTTPAPVLSPINAKTATPVATMTFTAPEPTATSIYFDLVMTPTPWAWPVETAVPLSKSDSLYLQLTQKGYKLTSSGSLVGPGGFTYSAHLFINTDSPHYYSLNPTTKETIIVAFYRRDGAKDVFLGTQYLPLIESNDINSDYGEYADYAGILNWNWQRDELGLVLDFQGDNQMRPILKQYNFSSDVNQNGLPEFAVSMEFCSICSKPEGGIQLFEIQDTSVVKNITQNMPKLTLFKPHSKTPFTFYTYDKLGSFSYVYLYYVILVDRIYAWDGSEFIDVSSRYADEYLADANRIISNVKLSYGDSFDKVEIPPGPLILKILKLYEAAGMSKQGLQVFLDLTDSSHWPGSSNESLCWLQLARATAQQDMAKNREFDLSVGYLWNGFPRLDENARQLFQQAGYNISACDLVKP